MARRDPPVHAGHLDLLPFVRRVFKHRMTDARLRTVESELLGVVRHEDVDGWEIPGRYLDFLRSGAAEPLHAVVRHNREDVRSLARLLVHIEAQFADEDGRSLAHRGDLAGLARAFSRERRLDEALDCLDTAVGGVDRRRADRIPTRTLWWTPRRPVDFGGRRPIRTHAAPPAPGLAVDGGADPRRAGAASSAARSIRRRRRRVAGLAAGIGPLAVVAWIEVAKLREHRLGDLRGRVRCRDQGPRARRSAAAHGPDRSPARPRDRRCASSDCVRRLDFAGTRAARVS